MRCLFESNYLFKKYFIVKLSHRTINKLNFFIFHGIIKCPAGKCPANFTSQYVKYAVLLWQRTKYKAVAVTSAGIDGLLMGLW